MQVNAGLQEKEFRHPTGVFNTPPEEFPSNAGRMLSLLLMECHMISGNPFPLYCRVSLLISTPPRFCNGWSIHSCKFCLLISRRSKILIADVMRSEDAMGNADLCTCLLSWISSVQQNPPTCAGESTNFPATDNSPQSFLPCGGNDYSSCTFLILIINSLLFDCKFCHYLHCDLFILWW